MIVSTARWRFFLLVLALLVAGWAVAWGMVLHVGKAEREAQALGARLGAAALIQRLDAELSLAAPETAGPPGSGGSVVGLAQAEAAARQILVQLGAYAPMSGVLLDGQGHLVLGQPQEVALRLQRAVQDLPVPQDGWLDLRGVVDGRARAYLSRSPHWTWVALLRCPLFDPTCSSTLPWLAMGSLALLLAFAVMVSWRTLTVGTGAPVSAREFGSEQARMEVVGRLSGRLAHEFNNHLGTISNSAHLIERHAGDPLLKQSAQAILRAVEATHRMTARLQRYATAVTAGPQTLDLTLWLLRREPALAEVVGKQMEMRLCVVSEPLWVAGVDPDALELALVGILLCIRHAAPDGSDVVLSTRRGEGASAGLEALAGPAGRVAQLCLEAGSRASGPSSLAVLGSGLAAQQAMAEKCAAHGLGLVDHVCTAAGGQAWVERGAAGQLVFRLAFPEVPIHLATSATSSLT